MTEQLEPDLRDIERDRDLPPDELYGDREADYWDAEDSDGNLAIYGACLVCGASRKTMTAGDGCGNVLTSLVCSADPLHPQ